MHGIIFVELKKFVDKRYEGGTWVRVSSAAGVDERSYMSVIDYPDAEAASIFEALARLTGHAVEDVHREYGMFIAPELLDLYGALIKPEWKTLDVLEHTEATIHKVVRAQVAGALPPVLICRRISPRELAMTYVSKRKMCGMAKGTALGIAARYGERLAISEESCMRRGDAACAMSFTIVES